MLLAYNTNGLANHDLLDAIDLLTEIGYAGVSITLDHGALNPFDAKTDAQCDQVAAALEKHHLHCVIETGARFLLDPRNKHEPTLVSPEPAGRSKRVDFIARAIDIAARLKADCVSLWSGVVRDGAGRAEGFSRLVNGLAAILPIADRHGVDLAFEPEPGMLVDTVDCYGELLAELTSHGVVTTRLRLTIDVGHLHCQKELPIGKRIRQWRERLANVHIEDMCAGVHEHLMFGEGEIDFPPVIAALANIRYDGLLSVELSRHSHEGPQAALRAYNYLSPLIKDAGGA